MENFEVSDAGDILVDTKQLDWLDVGGGTYFKILRAFRIRKLRIS